MSSKATSEPGQAAIFSALGDTTRLSLVARLCREAPCSISQLSSGSHITRQAITKHLRVLESAGLVRTEAIGRARVYELNPEPLEQAQSYLASVSRQWDEALARLQAFVEET